MSAFVSIVWVRMESRSRKASRSSCKLSTEQSQSDSVRMLQLNSASAAIPRHPRISWTEWIHPLVQDSPDRDLVYLDLHTTSRTARTLCQPLDPGPGHRHLTNGTHPSTQQFLKSYRSCDCHDTKLATCSTLQAVDRAEKNIIVLCRLRH